MKSWERIPWRMKNSRDRLRIIQTGLLWIFQTFTPPEWLHSKFVWLEQRSPLKIECSGDVDSFGPCDTTVFCLSKLRYHSTFRMPRRALPSIFSVIADIPLHNFRQSFSEFCPVNKEWRVRWCEPTFWGPLDVKPSHFCCDANGVGIRSMAE
jgi:hypothetical protein